jgi:hypothetical protein
VTVTEAVRVVDVSIWMGRAELLFGARVLASTGSDENPVLSPDDTILTFEPKSGSC